MAEGIEQRTTAEAAPGTGWVALRGARHVVAQAWPTLIVVGAVALVAGGQIAEDIADSPPLQMLAPDAAVGRWTIIVAVLYMLATAGWVDRAVDRWILALDGVFTLDRNRFERYAEGLRRPRTPVQVALLVASAVIVLAVFEVLGSSLPTDDPVTKQPLFMPPMGPGAAVILAGYTVVGWAILSLIYATIKRAQSLGQLSREPIEVDVFDTTKLLPLGNIALATALAPAGIIVILLVGYGRPSQPLGDPPARDAGQRARADPAAARHPSADGARPVRGPEPDQRPPAGDVRAGQRRDRDRHDRVRAAQQQGRGADVPAGDSPPDDDLAVPRFARLRPSRAHRQRAAHLHGHQRAHQGNLDPASDRPLTGP